MSTQGRQSPPPESQTGPQLKETPGTGQGIQDVPNKAQDVKKEVEVSISPFPTCIVNNQYSNYL